MLRAAPLISRVTSIARNLFVTGTDTEIGKTTIAAGLLHAARLAGLSTAAAAGAPGCEQTTAGLPVTTMPWFCSGSVLALDYAEANPFAFAPAIAPHLAARRATVPS